MLYIAVSEERRDDTFARPLKKSGDARIIFHVCFEKFLFKKWRCTRSPVLLCTAFSAKQCVLTLLVPTTRSVRDMCFTESRNDDKYDSAIVGIVGILVWFQL